MLGGVCEEGERWRRESEGGGRGRCGEGVAADVGRREGRDCDNQNRGLSKLHRNLVTV